MKGAQRKTLGQSCLGKGTEPEDLISFENPQIKIQTSYTCILIALEFIAQAQWAKLKTRMRILSWKTGFRPQKSCQGKGKLFRGNSKREQAAQGEPGQTEPVQSWGKKASDTWRKIRIAIEKEQESPDYHTHVENKDKNILKKCLFVFCFPNLDTLGYKIISLSC